MKKLVSILFLFLFSALVYAVDTKTTDLTEDTAPTTDDLLYTVDDPGGTPASRKATIANVLNNAIKEQDTLQSGATFYVSSGTVQTELNVPADTIDALTEIAASLKSGADATLLTGTAGSSGDCGEWNADGDLVTSGAPCGGSGGASTLEVLVPPNSSSPTATINMSSDTFVGTISGSTITITINFSSITAVGPTVDLADTAEITGTLAVGNGGSGATTLTDGGVLLGSGSGAITPLSVLADGSIIVGDGATDPVALAAFTNSTGDLIHEAGGLEADVSAFSGVLAISGGSTSEVNSKSELETQIADVSDFAEADGDVYSGVHDFGGATSIELVNGTGPTVDADGEIEISTDAFTSTGSSGTITFYSGGTTYYAVASTGVPGDNHIIKWDATLNQWSLETETGGAETNSLEVITTGIATTEIPIGTAADTVVYAALSGDATMTSGGVVTVANDSHDHTATTLSGVILDQETLQSGATFYVSSGTVETELNVPADTIDAIAEIASALRSGSDATLITGTSGSTGECAQWDSNGDLITSGSGCGGGGGASVLAVTTGTVTKFDVVTSSPTAVINFSSTSFSVELAGSATAYVSLDGDHGDFTYASELATLDNDVVAAAEMADADHGDVSWSGGVATVDNVAAANVAAGSLGSSVIASSIAVNAIGNAQMADDAITSSEMGDSDHGDVSWTANVATVDNVAAANIAAGSLGASVIASSVAVNSVGTLQVSNGTLVDADMANDALDADKVVGDTTDDDDLDVAAGGTGVSTLTDGAVLLGSGSGDITATTLATTEIMIGDGVGDPTFASLSGDATMTNAGVVTVVDDSHNHVITNIDSFTKAELETQTSDVANYAEADGDVFTGVHDFGGATSLEIPQSGVPTLDAVGEIALDTSLTDFQPSIAYSTGTTGAEMYIVGISSTEYLSVADNEIVKYDAALNEFRLEAETAGGTGAFSDAGDPIVQNTTGKDVHVGDGAGTLTGKLEVGGDADQPQMVIEGFSTQTDDIFIVQNDADTELFSISPSPSLKLLEVADAPADTAGYGQLWVNTATPNELFFTDDAGTDFQLGAGSDTNADKLYSWQAASTLPTIPQTVEFDGVAPGFQQNGSTTSVIGVSHDDSDDTCRAVNFIVPEDVNTSGTAEFYVTWYSSSVTSGSVQWYFSWTVANEGESWDQTLTEEDATSDAVQGTIDNITETTWTETLSNLGWTAEELVVGYFCRDGDGDKGTDDLTGDARALVYAIKIPRS